MQKPQQQNNEYDNETNEIIVILLNIFSMIHSLIIMAKKFLLVAIKEKLQFMKSLITINKIKLVKLKTRNLID